MKNTVVLLAVENDRLIHEVEYWKSQSNMLEKDSYRLGELEQKMHFLESENSLIKRNLQGRQKELDTLREQNHLLERHKYKAKELNTQLEFLQEEYKKLSKSVETWKTRALEQEQYHREINDLKSQFITLSAENEQLQEQLDERWADIQSLKNHLSLKGTQIEQLNEELESWKSKYTNLEQTRIVALEDKITLLATENHRLSQVIENIRKGSKIISQDVGSDLTELKGQIKFLISENETLSKELKGSNERASLIEEDRKRLERELKILRDVKQSGGDPLEARVTSLINENQKVTAILNDKNREVQELKRKLLELNELRRVATELENRMIYHSSENENLKAQILGLQRENDRYKGNLEMTTVQQQIRALFTENQNLQSQINQWLTTGGKEGRTKDELLHKLQNENDSLVKNMMELGETCEKLKIAFTASDQRAAAIEDENMHLTEVLQHDIKELETLRAKLRSLENVKLNVGEIIMKTSGILRQSGSNLAASPNKEFLTIPVAQKFGFTTTENERLTKETSNSKDSGTNK